MKNNDTFFCLKKNAILARWKMKKSFVASTEMYNFTTELYNICTTEVVQMYNLCRHSSRNVTLKSVTFLSAISCHFCNEEEHNCLLEPPCITAIWYREVQVGCLIIRQYNTERFKWDPLLSTYYAERCESLRCRSVSKIFSSIILTFQLFQLNKCQSLLHNWILSTEISAS